MNFPLRIVPFVTLPLVLLQGCDSSDAKEAEVSLRQKLADAPTHGEWVSYIGSGGDSVWAYLAFPERPDPAPAMIVIHEIYGLSDWIRSVADDLASEGYVAIAPDLLTRRGGTQEADQSRRLIRDLPQDSIIVDLNATYDHLNTLAAVQKDQVGVIGFCWGGRRSFNYAAANRRLKAAVVCYGSAPGPDQLANIEAPVLGVYAENDARINTEVPLVDSVMQASGNVYQYEFYPGTGHAFLRRRDVPSEADRAWSNILTFLNRQFGR